MAGNSWNALVSDVREAIADMETMGERAGGAADAAATAANLAGEAAAGAIEAAEAAGTAIEAANASALKWDEATAAAETLEAGEEATVEVTEKGGVKQFRFGLPRGRDGLTGEKGETGKCCVKFELSGTTLTIIRTL